MGEGELMGKKKEGGRKGGTRGAKTKVKEN